VSIKVKVKVSPCFINHHEVSALISAPDMGVRLGGGGGGAQVAWTPRAAEFKRQQNEYHKFKKKCDFVR
jgi:hypothetical protein